MTRVVEETTAKLGAPTILVNAAGISWGAPALDMPLEKMQEVLMVNVVGAFLCAQAVASGMRAAGWGKIVNVASVAGLVGTPPGVLDAVGYSASKGGLIALTRDLAAKWGSWGIRVNALAPGFFPTRMTERVIPRIQDFVKAWDPARAGGRDGRAGRGGALPREPGLRLRHRCHARRRWRHDRGMIPDLSPRATALRDQVAAFMAERVLPAEPVVEGEIAAGGWTPSGTIESLKVEARKAGLWNLFIPDTVRGAGLSVREYASLAEVMGRCWWASEVFNCSAPDTGNMDVLLAYGSKAQQDRWLAPLLEGKVRSCFGMTEPDVASSDATNIRTRITREGDALVISGRKWWTSGAGDPRCAIAIVMGQTNPDAAPHQRQSMVLVPMDAPGVTVTRMLSVFGYDDAPHGHGDVTFDNVRVPVENLIAGEGRGFEIAQGRLGPGRIHHCMRLIGQAERALELMIRRAKARVAFGSPLISRGSIREGIARSRVEIDQARLLVLHAAHRIDSVGAKAARREIGMIKVIAPVMALAIIDRAIQVHGGAGVSQDTFLARAWAQARTLRLADGPDEVHLESVARLEIASAGE